MTMDTCLSAHPLPYCMYVYPPPLNFSNKWPNIECFSLFLLHKLSVYGIQGKLLNWIKSFLTNRRQRVLLNGSPSDWEAVVSGVPQGTIMGPIFFLLFVNDVPNTFNCNVMLFADDAKLYSTINEEQDCINLQADLDSLVN